MRSTGNSWNEVRNGTATLPGDCDGLKIRSARRSVLSRLSGGSGRSLWAWVTLLPLRSRWTGRAPLAPGPRDSLGSRLTSLTLYAWWALETGLTPLTSRSRRTRGAWSARWSSRASWPRLALQICQLLGQCAHSGFKRVQAIRCRRLAGTAWFGGSPLLWSATRCCSFGCFLAWASCHRGLLRERGRRIHTLPCSHGLRAPRP